MKYFITTILALTILIVGTGTVIMITAPKSQEESKEVARCSTLSEKRAFVKMIDSLSSIHSMNSKDSIEYFKNDMKLNYIPFKSKKKSFEIIY